MSWDATLNHCQTHQSINRAEGGFGEDWGEGRISVGGTTGGEEVLCCFQGRPEEDRSMYSLYSNVGNITLIYCVYRKRFEGCRIQQMEKYVSMVTKRNKISSAWGLNNLLSSKVSKFPVICATRKLITVFTKARPLSLVRWIQCTVSNLTFPSGLFPSGF